jgi:hypothetical protein
MLRSAVYHGLWSYIQLVSSHRSLSIAYLTGCARLACGAVIFSVVLLITLWLVSLMGLPAWMHRKAQTMNQNFVDFLGIFASLFPLGMTISAAVITTIVCIIDMIIVGEGISRAHKNPQAQTTVHFGGVPWLSFVAMLLTWIGVVEAYRASFTFSKWK